MKLIASGDPQINSNYIELYALPNDNNVYYLELTANAYHFYNGTGRTYASLSVGNLVASSSYSYSYVGPGSQTGGQYQMNSNNSNSFVTGIIAGNGQKIIGQSSGSNYDGSVNYASRNTFHYRVYSLTFN